MNKKQKLAALGAAGAVTASCAFSALAYFKTAPSIPAPVEKKIVVHPVVRIRVEQDHRFDPGSNQVEINSDTGN